MLGFLPGFCYLGGLDERIHTPRLANPRIKINAGSVGIGGSQTGFIQNTMILLRKEKLFSLHRLSFAAHTMKPVSYTHLSSVITAPSLRLFTRVPSSS